MKLKKKELSQIIENYVLSERLAAIEYEYVPPRCDFDFDPKFLRVISIIKNGGTIPKNVVPDEEFADLMNPLFLTAVTDAFLPFMNLLVVPVFGVNTACTVLRRLQATFNKMEREYRSGLVVTDELKDDTSDGETTTVLVSREDYNNYFLRTFPDILTTERISLTRSRHSDLLDFVPAGFTKNEIKLASFLLGNLSKAKTDNATKVEDIVIYFKRLLASESVSSRDIINGTRKSEHIDGYDESDLKKIVRKSIESLGETERIGSSKLLLIINDLFNKLVDKRIIDVS